MIDDRKFDTEEAKRYELCSIVRCTAKKPQKSFKNWHDTPLQQEIYVLIYTVVCRGKFPRAY